jgi:hypothetical protein
MTKARGVACGFILLALSACGSMLPGVVDALPDDVNGLEVTEQSLAVDGRLSAALDDEGLPADAITGHEARWGDDIRLVMLRFDAVGLEEVSRVARSLLGIGDVDSALGFVGDQTVFNLTGPDVEGVAYQFVPAGDGSETIMYTIVAPTEADAEPIVRAIGDAIPPQD